MSKKLKRLAHSAQHAKFVHNLQNYEKFVYEVKKVSIVWYEQATPVNEMKQKVEKVWKQQIKNLFKNKYHFVFIRVV